MISKELLSEVLGQKVIEIKKARQQWDMEVLPVIAIEEFERRGLILSKEEQYYFNIYELAHKCKEWANALGYSIATWLYGDWASCKVYTHYQIGTDNGVTYTKYTSQHSGDTEPEAIFKACQWILDNKDN